MRKRKILVAAVLLLTLVGVMFAQRRRGPFPFREDDDVPMPADAGDKQQRHEKKQI